jgi:hypothetical protein
MTDEIKIQTTPAAPAGAQTPLTTDEMVSTHGHSQNQNTLSFCRGTNVVGTAARMVSPAANSREGATVSGMAVDSPTPAGVKPVDSKTFQGSYPGDHRNNPGDVAKVSLDRAAVGAGSPRGLAGQFPNGRRDATLGSFSKDSGS